MKIKHALTGLALFATAASTEAWAAIGPFQVTAVQAPGAKPCAFFQVNNAGPWYAIPMSDPSFPQEYELMLSAYMSGFAVTFVTTTAQTNCASYYGTSQLQLGTGN
jgi:hypothetical protein